MQFKLCYECLSRQQLGAYCSFNLAGHKDRLSAKGAQKRAVPSVRTHPRWTQIRESIAIGEVFSMTEHPEERCDTLIIPVILNVPV